MVQKECGIKDRYVMFQKKKNYYIIIIDFILDLKIKSKYSSICAKNIPKICFETEVNFLFVD